MAGFTFVLQVQGACDFKDTSKVVSDTTATDKTGRKLLPSIMSAAPNIFLLVKSEPGWCHGFQAHSIAMCYYTFWRWFLGSPGGWWAVSNFGEITGTVAIEMQNNSYIHALDSGLFTVGAPHKGKKTRWRDFTIQGRRHDEARVTFIQCDHFFSAQ